MECGFITQNSADCKKYVILKSWNKVRAKRVANFFVLGSCMLQQFVWHV
jgi:hypothetical protein